MQTFTRMDQGSVEEWKYILKEHQPHFAEMPNRIKTMLGQLKEIRVGFLVDQLEHCLQTATRAERAGAREEIVLAALCHDIGKVISIPNHPAIAAEILRPYVSQETYWVIKTHQDFQGKHYYQLLGKDPAAREQYRDHPGFNLGVQFADEWDQASFDPNYDTLPLEHFEPLIDKFFSQSKM